MTDAEMTDAEMTDAFWRAHDGSLPREAPGSENTTRLLLTLAGPLPPEPRVLDAGCGTGAASVLLAQLTGGRVTAVDLHEPFLARVRDRAETAGVADRVTAVHASMDDLPVGAGSVDLLWAEGSAYSIGVDTALAAWRPLLAPGGVVVLTDAEWLTPDPAPAARSFWDAGYPAMRATAGNVAAFAQAGWQVRALYVLPDSDWDEYYRPLADRIEELRREGLAVDPLVEELDVRAAHGTDYGYTGYVLAPRLGQRGEPIE